MTSDATSARPVQEPPSGSVVAIDWGSHRQEVWVASKSNVGCWYSPDLPLACLEWARLLRRSEGRTLTLLAPMPEEPR